MNVRFLDITSIRRACTFLPIKASVHPCQKAVKGFIRREAFPGTSRIEGLFFVRASGPFHWFG